MNVDREAGFTLLEILVAIMLASLLLSAIYGVFSASSNAKEAVEKKGNALHLGRVLSARLDRELLGLALDAPADKALLSGGTDSRGDAFIEMLTTSSGSPSPGLRWVRYRLGTDSDERMTLWRSEKGLVSTTEPAEERVAQGIDKLVFAFFDGSSWREQWNSLNDGRPKLVRAEISLHDLPDEPPLPCVFELSQPRR